MKIERNKERIQQTGEVFTPLELVNEILEKLPEDVWQKDKTFLDNSCGDGNFLVCVIAWKVEKGSSILQALKTTYGVDIMQDNVLHARDRLVTLAKQLDPKVNVNKCREIVGRNIVCADALKYNYSFDDEKESLLIY